MGVRHKAGLPPHHREFPTSPEEVMVAEGRLWKTELRALNARVLQKTYRMRPLDECMNK